jgi:hypothetical protein
MNSHLTRLGRAAACAAVLLLLVPSPGQATILAPGDVVVPVVLADPVAPGDVEASLDELAFATPFYSGTLTAAVVRNAGGTLDFYYQVTNNASSIHSLSRNTDSLFADATTTFPTDVYYRTDDAGLPALFSTGVAGATPLTADRSPGGEVVGFQFTQLGLGSGTRINPGETSMILVIRTDAVDFTDGFSSLLNGLPVALTTFGPATAQAPIPEPASLLLLSSAFGAASYMARNRRRRKSAQT